MGTTVAEEEAQPSAASAEVRVVPEFSVPVNWRESRRHMERVVVAGRGPTDTDVMFITSSVMAEECAEEEMGVHGVVMKRKPMYLKGPHGVALKDLCTSVGILVDREVYFTALVKWLLPAGSTLNPKPKDYAPGLACLDREIREVQPKIVVTFGKAAFECLVNVKLKYQDAIGAWFWSEKYQCRVMPMAHVYYVAAKPEWMERYRIDMAQVKQGIEEMRGVVVAKLPLNYRTVSTSKQLRDLVDEIRHHKLWSIDCEWHGRHHVEGKLRSLQICWQAGHGAYIRFMDDKLNYAMDKPYRELGDILAPAWNDPDLKLVGHHISADLPWTYTRLGLDWYNKARLDTEFAYQCCNEHGERGLERMSLRYSDLGRYEMDLEAWKRAHKTDVGDGYGLVPDEILIDYAIKDVDVPMRALPYIERDLDQQGMLPYYQNIMNPFVTNTFTSFALLGLPMNRSVLEEMRDLYGYAYNEMDRHFRAGMHEEAWPLLGTVKAKGMPVVQALTDPEAKAAVARSFGMNFAGELREAYENARADEQDPVPALRSMCGEVEGLEPAIQHAVGASQFNIRSPDQLKCWLYDVKGYMPIKSTANKSKGVPATDWEKVMKWKPDRREGIQPAVDKQSLQILQASHKDPMLDQLLSLNAVGNVKKAFLKEPERDDNGQIIEEAGLLGWLADDDCVHGMFSMTETGRPRAWKPNSLNWPSYVQERILIGIKAVLEKAHEEGRLPEQFRPYVEGKKLLPLRSAVQAPPGYIFTESDFKTAEVRGLGYIGNDSNLIRIMTEPDPQFGITMKGDQVRLHFARDCGIPPDRQDPKYIMAVWADNKLLYTVKSEDLQRHNNGCLVHPEADLHWSLIEMVRKCPRECMIKKTDRGAGKVGNFSSAYGATEGTLERKIEADTGVKPPPGTGKDILDALQARQPSATAYLESCEERPVNPGFARAASGKVRHFVLPPDVAGLSGKLKKSIISAQARESRNFEMQESVAATAQRAANWLLDFGVKYGLKGRAITVLYDSVVTMCPMEERFIWAKAHEICMHLGNGWAYHGRILRYPIDTEFNVGWSLRPKDHAPTKAIASLFDSRAYAGTPESMKPLEEWLDSWVKYLTENESASLTFSGLN